MLLERDRLRARKRERSREREREREIREHCLRSALFAHCLRNGNKAQAEAIDLHVCVLPSCVCVCGFVCVCVKLCVLLLVSYANAQHERREQ